MSFVVLLSGNRPPEGSARDPPFDGNGERKLVPPDPGACPGLGGLRPAHGPAGRPGRPNGLGLLGRAGLGGRKELFGDRIGHRQLVLRPVRNTLSPSTRSSRYSSWYGSLYGSLSRSSIWDETFPLRSPSCWSLPDIDLQCLHRSHYITIRSMHDNARRRRDDHHERKNLLFRTDRDNYGMQNIACGIDQSVDHLCSRWTSGLT
jgi:hypothetical protein